MTLEDLLRKVVEVDGSDLHVTAAHLLKQKGRLFQW